MVVNPATVQNWSGVEPAKALRQRRPPRRKAAPSRRKPKPRTSDWETSLNFRNRKGALHVIQKGQAGNALYYVDANDERQTAWHEDIGKAMRFSSYEHAMGILDMLLDDMYSNAVSDYDFISL